MDAERFFCPRGPGEDSPFRPPFNGEARWRADGTCSYCGSMSAEAFFEAIGAGAELTPTDKSYKVYVGGRRKFYFQHLSLEQMQSFIDLWNEGKLRIGYPGHFYVPPFFMQLRPPASID